MAGWFGWASGSRTASERLASERGRGTGAEGEMGRVRLSKLACRAPFNRDNLSTCQNTWQASQRAWKGSWGWHKRGGGYQLSAVRKQKGEGNEGGK